MENSPEPIKPEGGGAELFGWLLAVLLAGGITWYALRHFEGKVGMFLPVFAVGVALALRMFRRDIGGGAGGAPGGLSGPEPVLADGVVPEPPAPSTDSEKTEALEALADESRFITRPAKGAVLPGGLPPAVRELFRAYEYAGVTDEEADVYLDSSEAGPSRVARGAIRIGMTYGDELVVYPGEEAVYEVCVGSPEEPAHRAEVEAACDTYADIWQWVLTRE